MKYPKVSELQKSTGTELTSNPCGCKHKNPYEVRSASGLEGTYADPDDAEHEAEQLRKEGVHGVTVQPRERGTRPRVPRFQLQQPRTNPAQRLFIGIRPTGIVYADKQRERDGDYMKIAFLPFQSLRLQWEAGNHPRELVDQIQRDADAIIARRGQPFEVSSSGQTVILGGEQRRRESAPPQFHQRQGKPPGVPNPGPSGKLGDPTSLGTWANGSRVQLGIWEFPAHAPNGILAEGDWVTIVSNHATTTGYVVVRDEASGARYERDGRSPLYSVDKARSARA